MLDWKPGDQVVCIYDGGLSASDQYLLSVYPHLIFPKYREIYTLRDISVVEGPIAVNPGMPCVRLKEIVNEPILFLITGQIMEMSWQYRIFRKLTDIKDWLELTREKDAPKPVLREVKKLMEEVL